MTADSLIDRINALRQSTINLEDDHSYNRAISDVIAIIRQHEAEQVMGEGDSRATDTAPEMVAEKPEIPNTPSPANMSDSDLSLSMNPVSPVNTSEIYCTQCGEPTHRDKGFSQCLNCVNAAARGIAERANKRTYEAIVTHPTNTSEIPVVKSVIANVEQIIRYEIYQSEEWHDAKTEGRVTETIRRLYPCLRTTEPVSVSLEDVAQDICLERVAPLNLNDTKSIVEKAYIAAGVKYVD